MVRPRIDPSQETVHISVRIPKRMRAYFERLGDGCFALGLRRLYKTRARMRDGDDAIILNVAEYAAISDKLERMTVEGEES